MWSPLPAASVCCAGLWVAIALANAILAGDFDLGRSRRAGDKFYFRAVSAGAANTDTSCAWAAGIRIKQPLAVDLVAGDDVLAFRGNQPVDELLSQLLLHRRMLLWIDQHDAVLIEQPLVALDRDGELAAILERQPGAPVSQYIGVRRRRRVERGTHALPDRLVPVVLSLLDVDASHLPEGELGDMRAAAIAPGDERRGLVLDRLERRDDVVAALDAGRIALWADQDEVVVHDRKALHAEAFRQEFFLRRLGMHEHHIGVAAARGVERLAGTLGDDFHVDAGLLFEDRQQIPEQAGILRRRGRGDHDGLFLSHGRRSERNGYDGKQQTA